MAKIGVVLSGCGVFDGAEIQEAVLTLLALDRLGQEIVCMAPRVQLKEIDHLSQQETGQQRDVLTESARIARGEIVDLATVQASEIDAIVFPGGFGAAKNLSDFAYKGPEASVEKSTQDLILAMHQAKKPIGAICIAPAVMAAAFAKSGHKITVTIGNDAGTALAIETLGAVHQNCPVDDIVFDQANKLVTTPAYMLGPNIAQVAKGIDKLVAKIVEICG